MTDQRVERRPARSNDDPAVVLPNDGVTRPRIDPAHRTGLSSEEASKQGHRACIHLGMPKAASTSLQQHLFLGHSGVKYLGLIFPMRSLGADLAESGRLLAGLLHRAPRSEPTAKQLQQCRAGLTAHLALPENEARIPVWSNELLCTTRGPQERQARIFREVLGPCNVLLVVRHPAKFAESLYHTHCTAVNRHPPRRYSEVPREFRGQVRRYRRWLDKTLGKPPLLPDIGTWFERMWRDPDKPQADFACMQYADTARNYAEVFGRDAVRIVLFEEMIADIPGVVGDVCDFMGIDRETGIRQMLKKPSNQRWTMEQIEQVKTLERSTWKKLMFRLASPERRREMMHMGRYSKQKNAPKARVEIPRMWRDRLADYTRDQNRCLKEEWGLPVDQYDYPM